MADGQRSTFGRFGRGAAFLAGALVASLVTASAVVAATGSFTDVPDTNPFFDDIEAVAGACIAGGFPDGTYRPGEPVSRQAMAAFLNRTASKAFRGTKVPGTINFGSGAGSSPLVPVASVTVVVPDLPGSCQVPVELHGTMGANVIGTLATTCTGTCQLRSVLAVNGTAIPDGTMAARALADNAQLALPVSGLVLQADGTTVTYTLNAQGFNVLTNKGGVFADRHLHAVIHPMDATPAP